MGLLLQRRENKGNALESKLYHIIKRLVSENGLALPSGLVYTTAKEELNGEDVQGKPQSFYTVEHDLVSKRQIVSILTDKFTAQRKSDGKIRLLIFNEEKLKRLGYTYDLADTIDILPADASDTIYTSRQNMDGYLKGQTLPNPPEITVTAPIKAENTIEPAKITTSDGSEDPASSIQVSKASEVSRGEDQSN